jgi:heme exporter protein CcmD
MNLGPYSAFILGAYAVAFVTIGALIAWVVFDYRAQKRTLDEFELRGIVRRSEPRASEPVIP